MRQTISFRTYRGPEDLGGIAAIIGSCWRKTGVRTQVHLGNVGWRLADVDLTRPYDDIGLWSKDDGQVVALALVYKTIPVDLLIDPDGGDPGLLLHAVLDWTEARWRAVNGSTGCDRTLRIGCLESDELRKTVLSQRGYPMGDRSYIRFACGLDSAPAKAVLPSGLRLRTISVPGDIGDVVRLHNSVFDSPELTLADYGRLAALPWYRPELGCLVENETGKVVSFALGWIDRQARAIEFEPVACHSDWRRRGVTRGLLHEIMRRAADCGATVACVTARGENEGTAAFYRASGFADHVTELVFLHAGSSTPLH